MILPLITEIAVGGIYDRGVPNKERIILHTTADVALAQFGVLLAFRVPLKADTPATPLNDHFLWLTDRNVVAGTTIFIYSGPGSSRETTVSGTDQPALVLHWNKATTLFADTNILPVLFRIGAIIIPVAINVPQKKAIAP